MGESKTMKRIRVLHSELNGELGGIESFLYNVYRFIDVQGTNYLAEDCNRLMECYRRNFEAVQLR